MKFLKILILTLIGYTSFAQNVKISDMTAATDLNSATLPIIQGGTNKKAAISLFDTRFGGTSTPTASTNSQWDANKNFFANNFSPAYTSVTTAAGTTTLTVASQRVIDFTGSTTQTVVLPVTSTLWLGGPIFKITNSSSGNITIQTSGGNTLAVLPANWYVDLYCLSLSGTGTSSWRAEIVPYSPFSAQGQLLYSDAAVNGTYPPAALNLGSANTVLHGGSTAPSYSAVSISADVSGLATGIATWLGTPSWTNFNSAITGTAPYWALTGTSTATGVMTITSNTANQHIFNGTWTATANSQFHAQFGGTFDGRAGNADVLAGYIFNPVMNQRANSEIVTAVKINPTLNTNSFTGANGNATIPRALEVTTGRVVIGTGAEDVVGDQSQLFVNNVGANTYMFALKSSGGNNALRILNSNGGMQIGTASGYFVCGDMTTPSISGLGYLFYPNGISKNDASQWSLVTVTSNSANAQTGSGGITALNIDNNSFVVSSGTGAFNWVRAAGVINQTSTASGAITLFNLIPTYTSNKGTTTAIKYAPTETSVTGAHYFIANSSTTALSGFGTATPTSAMIQINAAGSNAALKTVGVGTGTNKSLDSYQSDGTTNILFLKDNGDFQVGLSSSKWGMFGTSAVSQQSVLGILVNNVTSGGTTSQIDDFTNLTVYASDAATIRNDIYQLAKKQLAIETALRNYGILKD